MSAPTILLIEDSEMNRDMLSRRLQKHQFSVLLAVDAEQGIHMAEMHQPDLILMDIGLPLVDGWEATQRLKSNSKTCSIPIIALTAHAMTGDREKAIAAGCDDYDTKPVAFTRLVDKISLLLKKS